MYHICLHIHNTRLNVCTRWSQSWKNMCSVGFRIKDCLSDRQTENSCLHFYSFRKNFKRKTKQQFRVRNSTVSLISFRRVAIKSQNKSVAVCAMCTMCASASWIETTLNSRACCRLLIFWGLVSIL
jgi:hypothetical protein